MWYHSRMRIHFAAHPVFVSIAVTMLTNTPVRPSENKSPPCKCRRCSLFHICSTSSHPQKQTIITPRLLKLFPLSVRLPHIFLTCFCVLMSPHTLHATTPSVPGGMSAILVRRMLAPFKRLNVTSTHKPTQNRALIHSAFKILVFKIPTAHTNLCRFGKSASFQQ